MRELLAENGQEQDDFYSTGKLQHPKSGLLQVMHWPGDTKKACLNGDRLLKLLIYSLFT